MNISIPHCHHMHWHSNAKPFILLEASISSVMVASLCQYSIIATMVIYLISIYCLNWHLVSLERAIPHPYYLYCAFYHYWLLMSYECGSFFIDDTAQLPGEPSDYHHLYWIYLPLIIWSRKNIKLLKFNYVIYVVQTDNTTTVVSVVNYVITI